MKKWLSYFSALMCMSLTFTGCGTEAEDAIISESLEIVEDILNEELENMTEQTDESASDVVDTEDSEEYVDIESSDITEEDYVEESYVEDDTHSSDVDEYSVVEGGSYTTKEEVALYIYTYGELPANFITKSEAQDLGWVSKEGNLWDVAPGMSIGGDRYGNYEQLLPDGKYRECDINYAGGYRGDERIVYSTDGYIYYTDDHYESFTQLYPAG